VSFEADAYVGYRIGRAHKDLEAARRCADHDVPPDDGVAPGHHEVRGSVDAAGGPLRLNLNVHCGPAP
jgi:hypothetical protein